MYFASACKYNTITGNTANNNTSSTGSFGICLDSDSDYNTIGGNTCCKNITSGVGTGYGIRINAANCNENLVSLNKLTGNDTNYSDAGTGTESIDLDTVCEAGNTTDVVAITFTGTNSEANSLHISESGGDNFMLWHDGSNAYMKTDAGVINFSSTMYGLANLYHRSGTRSRWYDASNNGYWQMKYDGTRGILSGFGDLHIQTNGDAVNYHIFSNTKYYPNVNGIDLGQNTALTWDVIYYHTLTDKTCASFTHYDMIELYTLLKSIQARNDGILHHDKNSIKYSPHIDMATVPDEFAVIADEDYDLENIPIEIDGKIKKSGIIHYKKGEKCGINFNTLVYAMNELIVKQYEKINELENRIVKLENKN